MVHKVKPDQVYLAYVKWNSYFALPIVLLSYSCIVLTYNRGSLQRVYDVPMKKLSLLCV